ncbi:MAG: hypothetical protein JWN40_3521 [Phycisphaerales bacterium]|nr:hypothetical protein [Phycisphaerales bacterium]
MPKLAWGKILQTCVTKNMNALLVAGQPPYWRCDEGLCAGAVPSVEAEDILSMLDEIVPGPDRIEAIPGCRSFRLGYGSGTFQFRVDMLGEPTPLAVVLTRLPPDAPELLREGFGWYEGWNSSASQLSWDQLLREGQRFGADALVMPGCPPFVWSPWGLHAYSVAPLSDDLVCSMIDEITPDPARIAQGRGVIHFCVWLSQAHDQFIAEVFEHPSPTLALLIHSKTLIPPSA